MHRNEGKFFQIRIWHLFVGISLVSASLWWMTQYGVETAEIEVLQFDVDVARTATNSEPAKLELLRVKFAFLQPLEDRSPVRNVFLTPQLISRRFEVGDKIKFRYRAKQVLGFEREDLEAAALELLGVDQEYVEEIIRENFE